MNHHERLKAGGWTWLANENVDVSHHIGQPEGSIHMNFDTYRRSVDGRLEILMVQDTSK